MALKIPEQSYILAPCIINNPIIEESAADREREREKPTNSIENQNSLQVKFV